MSDAKSSPGRHPTDVAPGDRHQTDRHQTDRHQTDRHQSDRPQSDANSGETIRTYVAGFGLAVLLTVVSFVVARTTLVWQPSIPIALFVLAIAQIGVHLVFFLHVTTGPDGVNNAMALAFGVLIVLLLIGGSIRIMSHLNHNMPSMDRIIQMQR